MPKSYKKSTFCYGLSVAFWQWMWYNDFKLSLKSAKFAWRRELDLALHKKVRQSLSQLNWQFPLHRKGVTKGWRSGCKIQSLHSINQMGYPIFSVVYTTEVIQMLLGITYIRKKDLCYPGEHIGAPLKHKNY